MQTRERITALLVADPTRSDASTTREANAHALTVKRTRERLVATGGIPATRIGSDGVTRVIA